MVDKFTEKLGLTKYTLYVQDYGAPVGYRLAVKHPERVTGLVMQNGNAYDEGIDNDFWKPIKAYWKDRQPRRTPGHCVGSSRSKAPSGSTPRRPQRRGDQSGHLDHRPALLDRPGNKDIQFALFYSYGPTRRSTRRGRPTSASTSRRR